MLVYSYEEFVPSLPYILFVAELTLEQINAISAIASNFGGYFIFPTC
jgi:hypothetical protein